MGFLFLLLSNHQLYPYYLWIFFFYQTNPLTQIAHGRKLNHLWPRGFHAFITFLRHLSYARDNHKPLSLKCNHTKRHNINHSQKTPHLLLHLFSFTTTDIPTNFGASEATIQVATFLTSHLPPLTPLGTCIN